ncbi:MAG: hypothetical protein AB8F94_19495 [Saprospiraceae bacterium]
MTTIKGFLILIILSCFVNLSDAQTRKTKTVDHRKSTSKSKTKKSKRTRPTAPRPTARTSSPRNRVAASSATGPRKIMTGRDQVWVFPKVKRRRGGSLWTKPTSGEIKKHKKANFAYSYPVSFNHLHSYYSINKSNPLRQQLIDDNKIREFRDGLKKRITQTAGISEKGRSTHPSRKQTSVYYFRKIDLGGFIFTDAAKHIIVVDTLYVPAAAPGKSSFVSVGHGSKNYIKIIANCIVYESPINVSTINPNKTDMVFAANKFIFKSPYKNLTKVELFPTPPFYKNTTASNLKVYKDKIQRVEKTLLNRLYIYSMNQILEELLHQEISDKKRDQLLEEFNTYKFKKVNNALVKNDKRTMKLFNRLAEKEEKVMNWLHTKSMEQIITKLNSESNKWQKDRLLEAFQTYRKNKINADFLAKDSKTKIFFNEICSSFDSNYKNQSIEELRKEKGLRILVNGEIETLHEQPFKYYTFPTKASLIPVNNQTTGEPTALGFVTYYSTGESKLELDMEVALSFDQSALKKATQSLSENGLILEQKFPDSLVSISRQPLKINGETVGYIIPIGNQNVRFKVKLEEESLTLLQLFTGTINFKLDYYIKVHQQSYSQNIKLEINPLLIEDMTQGKILENFSVIEMSNMTDVVKVSSQLDPKLDNEGTLNFVEVMLEFNFQNETVFRGPYRFSSYSTLASELTIPFLKFSDNYSIKVKGFADYKNGRRDIKPFSENSNIIVIDEGVFE